MQSCRFQILVAVLLVSFAVGTHSLIAQSPASGTIKGSVTDRVSGTPLPGAHILVRGTQRGTASAADGNFAISQLPAGVYMLEYRSVGYESFIGTDIIVRPGRTTVADASLSPAAIEGEEVTTTAGYFSSGSVDALNAATFSFEEVRRSPGSAGDVSRIITSLPSVARVNDQRNSLAVRGGSPYENAFFVDNIPVPNINHFATQGSTGGALGMLNVDLLENVTFSAGGFGAAYGNRLSSIMDMRLREGNRDRFSAQANMDMSGLGGVLEGPLFDSSASWLVSFRRSYLDLLVKAFDVGNTVAPRMTDGQVKVVVDISATDQLSALEMFSQDRLNTDHATAVENTMMYYGDQDNLQNSAGATWRHVWGQSGFSQLTASHTVLKFTEEFRDIASEQVLYANRSTEQSVSLRSANRFAVGRSGSVEYGADLLRESSHYDNRFGESTDPLGATLPGVQIRRALASTTTGLFVSFAFEPLPSFTTTAGVRVDYSDYTDRTYVSPRVACNLRLTDRTALTAAAGLYVQSIPHIILVQAQHSNELREPVARHLVLGLSHLLADDARLTIEGYLKTTSRLPVDLAQPQLFMLDEIFTGSTFVGDHPELSDAGEARAYGLEVMLQKKMARDFYGLASLSLGRSQYKALDGFWRNRVFDNRVSFCLEGGYKPNDRWDFSLRWVYAGGVPYTPLDLEASQKINAGVLDAGRINADRLPAYHSMNIRADRRFNFDRSSLVVYLSAWNVYNRQNVASFFWNKITAAEDTEYQFGLLPILGIEYEF
jgi:hypothetical protein